MNQQRSEKHQNLMKSGQGLQVYISKCDDEAFKMGEIRAQFWNKKERSIRSLKMLAMTWGMAFVSIFIPGLHFILVPGLILAGPIAAYLIYGQERAILGGEGTCPHCEKFLPIASGSYKFPFSDLCSECQNRVEIRLPQLHSLVKHPQG